MPFELDSAVFALTKDWLPSLLRVMRLQRSEREDEINGIADVFGDPVQLAEFYVEPDCQQLNPADDDEDEARYVVREPVFKRLQYFFGGGPSVTGGHQMFILADSGMGKSSVLMMLKLAHLKSFWPKNYDCVLLKLGGDTISQLASIKAKRKTVLLLDALDEDPQSWGRIKDRLTDILIASKSFWRVIISCRTQFFSAGEDPFNRRGRVEVANFLCPVIYLSLFSDEQVLDYLKRRFPNNERRVLDARRLLSKMHSLRFRPMLLAHIEDLLQSETEEWTEYSIYHALVTAWLHRERAKVLPGRKMPETADLWKVCSRLAFQLHATGKREMEVQALEAIMGDDFRHLSKLDISGRSLLNKNSQGAYRFSHYSVQEFLVVRNVVMGGTKRLASAIRPTDQLVAFLLSWLSGHSLEARAKVSLSGFDFQGANLSGVDFRGVSFAKGMLFGAILVGADLRQVNLTDCELSGADLAGADLSSADLTGAKLSGARLNGANLTRACLRNTDLTGSFLCKANLTQVDGVRVRLTSATLTEANLRGADLLEAQLIRTNLTDADLTEARLAKARLSGATLLRATLKGAIFRNANLEGADLRSAVCEGADLRETRLERANLGEALLDKADLRNATSNKETVWPASFDYGARVLGNTAVGPAKPVSEGPTEGPGRA